MSQNKPGMTSNAHEIDNLMGRMRGEGGEKRWGKGRLENNEEDDDIQDGDSPKSLPANCIGMLLLGLFRSFYYAANPFAGNTT